MIAKFCAHQILDLLQWFSNKKTHIYRFPISGGPPSRKAKAKSPSTDPGFSIYPIFKSPFIKNGIYPYIDPSYRSIYRSIYPIFISNFFQYIHHRFSDLFPIFPWFGAFKSPPKNIQKLRISAPLRVVLEVEGLEASTLTPALQEFHPRNEDSVPLQWYIMCIYIYIYINSIYIICIVYSVCIYIYMCVFIYSIYIVYLQYMYIYIHTVKS